MGEQREHRQRRERERERERVQEERQVNNKLVAQNPFTLKTLPPIERPISLA